VTTVGKGHTVLRQTRRQSRAHPLQTLRKTRLSRAQEKVRSLRLRRNRNYPRVRVADKNASEAKSSLTRQMAIFVGFYVFNFALQ